MGIHAARTFVAGCLACLQLASAAHMTGKPGKTALPVTVERNGLHATVDDSTLFSAQADDVPFSLKSKLTVVNPAWTRVFYTSRLDSKMRHRAFRSEGTDGSVAVAMRMEDEQGCFAGTHTTTVGPGRLLDIAVTATFTTDTPALLEHRVAGILAAWVAGRDYECIDSSGTLTRGVLPGTPSSPKLDESVVASGFRTLRIDSRAGLLEIETSGTETFSLVDYRLNKWADGPPIFWFGILGRHLRRGEQADYGVSFRFAEMPHREAGAPRSIGAAVTPLKDALLPQTAPDRIIPTPKKLAWKKGEWEITRETKLTTAAGESSTADLAQVEEFVRADIAAWRRAAPDDAATSAKPAGNVARIVLKLAGTVPDDLCLREQYRLRVGRDTVLEASTTQGLMNAAKTLRQLFRLHGGRLCVRACEIHDHPSMPFRGVHFFTGRNARELQVRMVRDILGALKLNTLVYQCDYLEWKSRPELRHRRYGMAPDDAMAVAAEARRQAIEVIPLVNTFGHCEWLVATKEFIDLADDPELPYAYDPSNPKVYEICGAIYDEAIRMFRPRFFHIGHDEVTMRGFPKKEANRREGADKLVARDILHYYDFLKKRGIRTMIWGDMFLAPGEAPDATMAADKAEAAARRKMLPRDIFITDWHYAQEPAREFDSMSLFNREGFDAVACSWYPEKNIVNLARRAAQDYRDNPGRGRTYGLLQTTWAGYSFDDISFSSSTGQYAAYVLAAEAAWNGGADKPEDIPFDHRDEFLRLWSAGMLPPTGAAGWTVNLQDAATFPLEAGEDGWLGSRTGEHMADFPIGPAHLGRHGLMLAGTKDKPRAVLMSGLLNPPGVWPRTVEIRLDQPAATDFLVIASGATFGMPARKPLCVTTVVMDDGSTSTIEWQLGSNIFPLDDPQACILAPTLWRSTRARSEIRAVHGYYWRNPRPGARVASLRFESGHQASAMVLFGIGGIVLPDASRQE